MNLFTPPPPPPVKQPEWATWVRYRHPAHKIHTSRGLAHSALAYHVGQECALWHWTGGEWELTYHFPPGMKAADLPWRKP